jgi:hypothetical protein
MCNRKKGKCEKRTLEVLALDAVDDDLEPSPVTLKPKKPPKGFKQ